MEDERFLKGTDPRYIEAALSDPEGQLNETKADSARRQEEELYVPVTSQPTVPASKALKP